MFRAVTRTAVGLTIMLAFTAAVAGPAAAYYDPGKIGWPPKPTIPQTTSVAVDVADQDAGHLSFWTMIDNQGVTAAGNATFYGSPPSRASFGIIVPTPTGRGYWVVDAIGGDVESFGDAWKAPGFNTTGYKRYSSITSITDAAAMPDGQGLIAVDYAGHVWTLGSARPYGDVTKGPVCVEGQSPAPVAIRLNKDGSGYLIAGAGGAMWARGSNVAVHGDACDTSQQRTITSMAPTPDFTGYWLVDSKGTVRSYGSAANNLPGTLTNPKSPVTYITALPQTGYLLAHENGAVDVFGPATRATHPPRPVCRSSRVVHCPRQVRVLSCPLASEGRGEQRGRLR